MTSVNEVNMNSVNGIQDTAASRKQTSKLQLNPEDFITLFLKQLTTQNPLEPADSSTILQQMADISAIGASDKTQETLENLQKSINMSLGKNELLTATQMIGKRVEVPSQTSALVKDEGLAGSVLSMGPANDVKVKITNDQNEVVKELSLGSYSSGGLIEFNWDGVKTDGTTADPGYYRISASGVVNGKEQALDTAGAFKIKSVGMNPESGDVILNVDGFGGMGINDVIKIL